MSPVVAEPLNDWVDALVMLSVLDEPVSLAASRSGVPSVPGAVWSTTMFRVVVDPDSVVPSSPIAVMA